MRFGLKTGLDDKQIEVTREKYYMAYKLLRFLEHGVISSLCRAWVSGILRYFLRLARLQSFLSTSCPGTWLSPTYITCHIVYKRVPSTGLLNASVKIPMREKRC